MSKVLVTGGTGTFGYQIVTLLEKARQTPRVMSRGPRPADATREWAQVDLTSGQGLAEAVDGIDVIIHAASNSRAQTVETDVEGTRRLLEAARTAGVKHFVYISIVGIDRIPFDYYRHKLDAEKLIEANGVPWSILRTSQFHDLIDIFISTLDHPPLMIVPGALKSQSVDSGEVAARLVEIALGKPAGCLPDMGGPEVLTWGQMTRAWIRAQQMRRILIPVPPLTPLMRAFSLGLNIVKEGQFGKVTWEEWLTAKYGGKSR